jgi:hypothetical protein
MEHCWEFVERIHWFIEKNHWAGIDDPISEYMTIVAYLYHCKNCESRTVCLMGQYISEPFGLNCDEVIIRKIIE